MKIFSIIKVINYKTKNQIKESIYNFFINDLKIENITVYSHLSHGKTYNYLRNLKSPQYTKLFLMKNKKGFNTVFFIQNYDVIVVNKNFKIIELFNDVKPSFISDYFKESFYIFFAPVGFIKNTKLQKKLQVRIRRKILK